MTRKRLSQNGSMEFIVLGLLTALIALLAVPLFVSQEGANATAAVVQQK